MVGVDVDYAEVAGSRAMLMVCMTGTAVKVDDPVMLGDEFSRTYAALNDEIKAVNELKIIAGRFGVVTD